MHKLPGILLATAMLASTPLKAAEPAFVGTWGKDAQQCSISQELQGAPMVITADGYDQHEAHCKFADLRGVGPSWTMKALCSVEGDQQIEQLTLTAKGDTLDFIDEYGTRTLIRCE
ncbi:MAG: hypothetical protein K0U74_02705 [Alphaproteobacteria bacterium]|nr:hypothetical protein [Alphaproteobacteria bacterium]